MTCCLILRPFRLLADLWAGGIDRSRRADTFAHPVDGFRAPPGCVVGGFIERMLRKQSAAESQRREA
jgi:hypothetical protein